ncbi:YggS family pyridoxal phosphate-dependent enzyme [Ferrimonas gelatinilytica]|uniref:Pyridoxal phosphate homeostasis protein n=1 Tax=Ferrimonas gelatinilytica TaxID=1255257 RepID=A0ABP9S1F6_9GAMM
MTTIAERIIQAKSRVANAARSADRNAEEITLLAVSKTKPADDIRAAFEAGQSDFGENYLQEALDKIDQLQDLPLTWHFIGPLQSNKTRPVAEHFAWVHSIDRLKIAQRLSEQRPDTLPPLNLCLQVNISGEQSKSGVQPENLWQLAAEVAALPRVRLRGLMAIPAASNDDRQQRQAFAQMCELFIELQRHHPHIDTLSMGMSGDLEAAIAEGSTLVRLGTALFGARQ